MTGLLNPKSSEIGHFFLHDFRCVPRPWVLVSGISFFFSKSVFRGRSQAPKLRNLREKVVHLYRSKHPHLTPRALRFLDSSALRMMMTKRRQPIGGPYRAMTSLSWCRTGSTDTNVHIHKPNTLRGSQSARGRATDAGRLPPTT